MVSNSTSALTKKPHEKTTCGKTTELYYIWRKHAPPPLKQIKWRRFTKLVPDWFPATGSYH